MIVMKPHILKSYLAKPIFYLFLVVCLFCFRIAPVDAHRVNLFAWVEGDTVYVESKFSGGKKVKAGRIIVTDSEGVELITGTTNEKGEFSFKVPKKTDLKIVLLAGAAHRAEWTIPFAEIEMPAAEKPPVPEKSASAKKIIIGIGCILGLAGIAAYIHRRRKKAG
jgi:nickel transport protein